MASPHVHTLVEPPDRCENEQAWAHVPVSKHTEWCGQMAVAWYKPQTGQLITRGNFRCSSTNCPACGPDKISKYLTRLPEVWSNDQTYYLALPTNRRWLEAWKRQRAQAFADGHPFEYLTVKRRDYPSGGTESYIWASEPVAHPGLVWRPHSFTEAYRTLRDQLCLPGPLPSHFPPKATVSWQLKSAKGKVKPPAGWQTKIVHPDFYESLFLTEARKWAGATGVLPGEDSALPDPDAWHTRLCEVGIILGDKL